jgi:hypothetical protein
LVFLAGQILPLVSVPLPASGTSLRAGARRQVF